MSMASFKTNQPLSVPHKRLVLPLGHQPAILVTRTTSSKFTSLPELLPECPSLEQFSSALDLPHQRPTHQDTPFLDAAAQRGCHCYWKGSNADVSSTIYHELLCDPLEHHYHVISHNQNTDSNGLDLNQTSYPEPCSDPYVTSATTFENSHQPQPSSSADATLSKRNCLLEVIPIAWHTPLSNQLKFYKRTPDEVYSAPAQTDPTRKAQQLTSQHSKHPKKHSPKSKTHPHKSTKHTHKPSKSTPKPHPVTPNQSPSEPATENTHNTPSLIPTHADDIYASKPTQLAGKSHDSKPSITTQPLNGGGQSDKPIVSSPITLPNAHGSSTNDPTPSKDPIIDTKPLTNTQPSTGQDQSPKHGASSPVTVKSPSSNAGGSQLGDAAASTPVMRDSGATPSPVAVSSQTVTAAVVDPASEVPLAKQSVTSTNTPSSSILSPISSTNATSDPALKSPAEVNTNSPFQTVSGNTTSRISPAQTMDQNAVVTKALLGTFGAIVGLSILLIAGIWISRKRSGRNSDKRALGDLGSHASSGGQSVMRERLSVPTIMVAGQSGYRPSTESALVNMSPADPTTRYSSNGTGLLTRLQGTTEDLQRIEFLGGAVVGHLGSPHSPGLDEFGEEIGDRSPSHQPMIHRRDTAGSETDMMLGQQTPPGLSNPFENEVSSDDHHGGDAPPRY